MDLFLLLLLHILAGIAFVYFYGRLPKAVITFAFTFLGMSIVYFSIVLLNIYL